MVKTPKKNQRTDDIITISEEKMEHEWIRCPHCSKRIKSKNLARHTKRVHHKELYIERPSSYMNAKTISVVIIILILVVSAMGYVLFIAPENEPTGNGQNNNHSNKPNNNETEWWVSYNPEYSKGSGDDDWWINYPNQHPDSGSAVSHLDWVLDSLQDKPVVILDHSEGCIPCIQQQEDMDKVLEVYGEEVIYYDLLADGSDPRAYEAFDTYDPNGEPNYIPLTIMVTKIKDSNGNVKIAWHSAEGATGEDWIRSYMKDSIYYHHKSS
jgi:DNA-directed RNA polymerase subunit RPC12/RpoP